MSDEKDQQLSDVVAAWTAGTEPSEDDAVARLQRYRPTTLKRTAATASVAVGAVFLVATLFMDSQAPIRETIAGVIYCLMLVLPGAYWFFANNRDQATVKQWETKRRANEATARYLVPEERHLLGNPDPMPLLPKRRWWVIGIVVFLLLMVGGSVLEPVAY